MRRELLGRSDVSTMMIKTCVLNLGGSGARSQLDRWRSMWPVTSTWTGFLHRCPSRPPASGRWTKPLTRWWCAADRASSTQRGR